MKPSKIVEMILLSVLSGVIIGINLALLFPNKSYEPSWWAVGFSVLYAIFMLIRAFENDED